MRLFVNDLNEPAAFRSSSLWPSSSWPCGVTVGDFNADGWLDFATCHTVSDAVAQSSVAQRLQDPLQPQPNPHFPLYDPTIPPPAPEPAPVSTFPWSAVLTLIAAGFSVTMSELDDTEAARIYYTLDGSDPRAPDGTPHAQRHRDRSPRSLRPRHRGGDS